MLKRILSLAALATVITACQPEKETSQTTPQGKYRAFIVSQEREVPFFIEFEGEGENLKAYILNSDERLPTDLTVKEDSVILDMTVFDASLRARFVDNGLHGEWIKHYVQGYRAPFKASPVNNRQRFEITSI